MRPAPIDISPAALRAFQAHFSTTSRARGAAYAAGGRVAIADANHSWLVAEVQGTREYEVELDLRGETVHASCTCPLFTGSMEACKHLWATLLVANTERLLPDLGAARKLELFFGAPLDEEREAGDDDDDDYLELARRTPPPVRPPPSLRGGTSSWRDVLAGVTLAAATPATSHCELRFILDVEATVERGRLLVRPVERTGQHATVGWRPAQIMRPLTVYAGTEDAVVLAMLDGLSSISTLHGFSSRYIVEFDVPVSACREVVQRLCATGRTHLRDATAPALRWDGEPYALALEVAASEVRPGLVVRGWLERPGERVSVTDPALVLQGGLAFWPDRVAPVDDGGQFAWVAAERLRGPAALPAAEVEDLLEALHESPRVPALRLPPELALPEARVEGKPYALLKTKARDPWEIRTVISVEAGMDYEGTRARLETEGRVVVDRARRRLVRRDSSSEQAARQQLAAAGVRPLADWRWQETRAAWTVAAGRVEGAIRQLVGSGWRVEVDGRVRRSVAELSVDVTTGIDWLDVQVHVRFDGVDTPFPALLAAVKQRQTTVTLSDGSVGELSAEALDKLRRWTGMGEARGDALRFRKVQTALVAALADVDTHATFDDAFQRARAELHAFDGVKAKRPPATLRGSLRGYQQLGLGWFEALRRFGFGGCLADDMGLGKTVQVLAMLDARRQERPHPGPSLVVAPRSVLSNWVAEAARFTPGVRVLVHDGPNRISPGPHFADYDLVLTTYGLLRQDAAALARVELDYAVLDEAQAIKTMRTASAKAARGIRARHRLALTGTPLENHLGELASLLDFLNPGVLGTATALSSLAAGSRRVDEATRDVLARAVRPFFLRRTKREVAPELPDRIEQTLSCELPPAQRQKYDELQAHYRASLRRRVARDGVARSTAHILEALLRLRQAACHPGLLDDARRGEPSAKLDTLLEQLEALRLQGQKALVFSQFTSFLAIVRDRLDERKLVYEYLDGSTRDRAQRVARFQSDEACGVFLLSLKAGGVGLNLTAAEYVFLLDPWWNPAVEAQAIDRAHRIGQSRTVFAYKLLAAGTVEEKVAELQKQKRELADALFGSGGASLTGLTREDLEQLLG